MSNIQLEKEDLEAELNAISDEVRSKEKLLRESKQRGCMTSTRTGWEVKTEITKDLGLRNLQKISASESSFETLTKFKAIKASKQYSVNVKSNIRKYCQMGNFHWPWECRGYPTIFH